MKKLIIALCIFLPLQGCAAWTARTGTLQQQAYALESDYVAIQGAAALYVVRPDADPWTKRAIKETNRRASTALNILGDVAEGNALKFCAGETVVAVPVNTDRFFAQLACDDNLPGVLSKTAGIVAMLNSIIIELEGN